MNATHMGFTNAAFTHNTGFTHGATHSGADGGSITPAATCANSGFTW